MVDVLNDSTGAVEEFAFNIPQMVQNMTFEQSTKSSLKSDSNNLDDPEKVQLLDEE
jgi:hypothetical protein